MSPQVFGKEPGDRDPRPSNMIKACLLAAAVLTQSPPQDAIKEDQERTLAKRIEDYMSAELAVDHVGPHYEPTLAADLRAAPADMRQRLLGSRIKDLPGYVQADADTQDHHRRALRLHVLSSGEGRTRAAELFRASLKDYPIKLEYCDRVPPKGPKRDEGQLKLDRAILTLRSTILRDVGDAQDSCLMDEGLQLVAEADGLSRTAAVRYLNLILRKDPVALSKVKGVLADPKSRVFANHALSELVEKIESEQSKKKE